MIEYNREIVKHIRRSIYFLNNIRILCFIKKLMSILKYFTNYKKNTIKNTYL